MLFFSLSTYLYCFYEKNVLETILHTKDIFRQIHENAEIAFFHLSNSIYSLILWIFLNCCILNELILHIYAWHVITQRKLTSLCILLQSIVLKLPISSRKLDDNKSKKVLTINWTFGAVFIISKSESIFVHETFM